MNGEIKSEQGKKYAYLKGSSLNHEIGVLARAITLDTNCEYRIRFSAKGQGEFYVNGGASVITIDNGNPSSIAGAKEYSYSFYSKEKNVKLSFLAFYISPL
ncbi:hypothetical protein [Bacillus thuringiensis]|uniref:Uncharacterized protein n=1 Tax=Bacillus thuringiensis TaxID=1428 RepID=A0A9X6Y8S7_BACTU|nr:hypothetical protein [Bacillus thuringiensis]PEA87586.1 hypothetical protein CON71_23795 [Bacillus thuringiensis]